MEKRRASKPLTEAEAEDIIKPCTRCGEDKLVWPVEFEFIACYNCGSVFHADNEDEETKEAMFNLFFSAGRLSKLGEPPKKWA
jgi:hypothetical protein